MRAKIYKFFKSSRYHHFLFFHFKGLVFAALVIPAILAIVDFLKTKDFSKNPEFVLIVSMYAVAFCAPFLLLGYLLAAVLTHYKYTGKVRYYIGTLMAVLCVAFVSGIANSINFMMLVLPAVMPCIWYFGHLVKRHIEPFY